MKTTLFVLAMILGGSGLAAPASAEAAAGALQGDEGVAPEAWRHQGDADGDGLSDDFELRHGLDPNAVDSLADGMVDESRPDPSGKTMWEVQEAEKAASSGGDSGGGGTCGATGMELLVVLVGVALARWRRRAQVTGP